MTSIPQRRQVADGGFEELEVDWLGEVFVEAGFFAAFDVFFHAEAAEGDAFDGAAGEELLHEFQAGAVGEADVAYEQVEAALLLIGGGECGAATVGGADLVAEALEEALH